MNQPMGRLEALHFREAAFYTNDGRVGSIDVLRVHFRAPDGDYYEHDLQNGDWRITNQALQFLAKWGYRPSQIGDHDSTMRDCHDDQILLPLAPNEGADGGLGYGLAQTALSGGREALKDATWFDTEDDEESTDDRPDGPQSGPGPDPGTGNRAGVDHDADETEDSGVTVEKAHADSNAGMTVNVS